MPWRLPEDEQGRLQLAKSYPFPFPDQSYLLDYDQVRPLKAADFSGRTAVLGHGSNRSPEQLFRKFGGRPGREGQVPVSYAWITDYDVVYSAHVTRYGSIASNLAFSPGCRALVVLNWLTESQLERMHETEGMNYAYGWLEGVRLELEEGPAPQAVHVYVSPHGCLAQGDERIGLAAVPAKGRKSAVLHQEGAQELVWRRHDPDSPTLDHHILKNIEDSAWRAALLDSLGAEGLPAEVPHFRELARRGTYGQGG